MNVYCHCYPVFCCHRATAEVESQFEWVAVCEECKQRAFDRGLRVRKLQKTDGPMVSAARGIGAGSELEDASSLRLGSGPRAPLLGANPNRSGGAA